MIGSAQQIVYTDIVEVCQLIRIFQWKRPLQSFVFGIQGLVTHQIFCNLFLFQITVFP